MHSSRAKVGIYSRIGEPGCPGHYIIAKFHVGFPLRPERSKLSGATGLEEASRGRRVRLTDRTVYGWFKINVQKTP